jgi:hypothetical protein
MNDIEVYHALEAQLAPAFRARLASLRVPGLKALAREVNANTRGCLVRADWERAIEKVWRRQVWDEAGYRYGGHREFSRSLLK